jgi:hypothetical protein
MRPEPRDPEPGNSDLLSVVLTRMRQRSVKRRLVILLVGFAPAVVVVLLLAAGGAARGVQAASGRSAASNRAAARVAAARVLRRVPLPAGATEVGTDPGPSMWLGSSVAGTPATPDLVDLHRFWRLPGDPQTAIEWIQAHPPAGATMSTTGTGGQYGTTVMWSVTFAFPAVPGRISEEMLGVGVTAARGGGTAMRADGFAVWLIPRPPAERVPAGTHAVAVFVDHLGGTDVLVSRVTAPQKIRRLVAFIDSRQLAQPGARSCPEIGPDTKLLDLRFLAAPGETPLARAVEDGCDGLTFSIRGHPEPGLAEDADLGHLLRKLGALPARRAAGAGPA